MLVESAVGTMVVELAPEFAPDHVAAIRALVNAGRFDGGAITRVQDNYVVQWAVKPEAGASAVGQAPAARPPRTRPKPLPPEFERPLKGITFTPLGSPDAYAEAGFVNGWPVGIDRKDGTAGLAHCYGMVGAGHDMPPDTGDSSELYAVIGHAPRHLDRNIAVVGRVISGIEPHAALKRGTAELGFYATPGEQTPIVRVRMADKIADAPRFTVMDTTSASFIAYRDARANRTGFFVRPAGAVDLCNVRVPIRPVPRK
jgi:peptidylprolyl isomerase